MQDIIKKLPADNTLMSKKDYESDSRPKEQACIETGLPLLLI